jgi:hypothetical protein
MKNTRKRLRFTVVAFLLLVTNLTVLGQKKIYHPPPIHPEHPVVSHPIGELPHLPEVKPKLNDPLLIKKTSPGILNKPPFELKPNHSHPVKLTCKQKPNQSKCSKKKSLASKGIKKI